MRGSYPTKVSEIAPYYEMGRAVEGESIFSWKWIEPFFRETLRKRPGVQHAGDLIAQMRAAGFERTLRAGQSLASLTLSRSRRHGLREDQPNISFVFRGDAGM